MAKHATFIKEKTMTPKSRLFQASFSTALLRSAAIAMALIVSASPALAAGPVTLSCQPNETKLNGVRQPDDTGSTLTLRINYATGLVEQLAPSGKAYVGGVATADISPNAITWSEYNAPFRGKIDRLSGTGWIEHNSSPVDRYYVSFTCREVTKPKF
jgi:hypothetical protein